MDVTAHKTSIAQRFWFVPVLAAYAGVVAYALFHHEPWFDEAQAWLLARDCDLGALCRSVLRYEGHPILWYLILKIAIACHLPYEAIGYLGGAFAVVGVAILLAKSPFPKPVAALLPFTFYLCYQYAVIARSYVLLPALLFTIAILERGKWERPIRWVVPLILLANVSAHAFLIAGGIVLVHAVKLLFGWRGLDSPSRKRQIAALLLFAMAALLVVLMLWPARDCVAKTGLNGQLTLPDQVEETSDAIDSAMFGCPLLTLAFLLASGYWFAITGVLPLFLVVWLPVIGLFFALRVAEHHHGILLVAWLFVFWCSVDAFALLRARHTVNRRLRVAWYVMLVFVAGLIVRQTVWTGYAVAHETMYPYCGSKATANYIKAHGLTNCRIAGVREFVAAILPYFPKNIIANFPNERGLSYIDWHESCQTLRYAFSADDSLAESYDLIVWPEQGNKLAAPWENPKLVSHLPANWRYVGYFPGRLIYKDRSTYYTGFALFASKKIAERFGLATAQGETAGGAKEKKPSATLSGKIVRATANLYLHLGELLHRIEPQAELDLYANVLKIRFVGLHETELSSETKFPISESTLTLIWLPCYKAAVHSHLGARFARSRPVLAMRNLQEALRLCPRDFDAYLNVGIILAREGRLPEANLACQRALRLLPKYEATSPALPQVFELLAALNEPRLAPEARQDSTSAGY